ncbi:MAG: DeoR family transcriptional regulator [Aliarcobacter sp.]|jgi:predicted DNA-binding transcriptional regulator YafY|nr:DeoR family transcriptional regulator [Aliarcobacter sp.]
MYKHDYDKKLFRLIDILGKLYRGENLSIDEYAQEYNVSTKTIQRDFNEKLTSFPIYQDKKIWKMNNEEFTKLYFDRNR